MQAAESQLKSRPGFGPVFAFQLNLCRFFDEKRRIRGLKWEKPYGILWVLWKSITRNTLAEGKVCTVKRIVGKWLPPAIAALLAFVLTLLQPFAVFDYLITDRLYSQLRQTDRNIMIISIDEYALDSYGSFGTWSRERTAELLNVLYADPENAPAVVGLDITFQGEHDPAIDTALAEACRGRNVVASGTLVFHGDVVEDESGSLKYDAFHIEMVELPYDALRQNVTTGFTNVFLGTDSVNRFQMRQAQYNGESIDSFSWAIAEKYCEKTGKTLRVPLSDSAGRFRFFYAGQSGEFQHVSLKNVLDGSIPATEFRNKIVLFGAYASGMQDNYLATADTGGSMFGVEIQANVIQALLEGATAVPANRLLHAAVVALLVFLLFVLADGRKLFAAIAIPAAGLLVHLIAGKLLSAKGILIAQLYPAAVFILMIAYFLVRKYLYEARKRQQVIKIFGKYMEPRLVRQLAKDDDLGASLGGQRREVAVLFVDIRGFTTMSEALEPEQVVDILNAYLGLVTQCIFKHHGMLDKFIGDAAMAVFNAPADQEDYLFEAVAAAWDIAQGSRVLEEDLMNRFGRSVSYGIGVNCGPAVVGNIGCEFRMDYTAIGDTVNTAARLEANAKRGEILISDTLCKKLEGRILTESAGQMTFKGKSGPMDVSRVVGLKETCHE